MRYLGPDVSPAGNASAGCRHKAARGKAIQFDFGQIGRRTIRLPELSLPEFRAMSRFIDFQ
jgi:hypothetical protein